MSKTVSIEYAVEQRWPGVGSWQRWSSRFEDVTDAGKDAQHKMDMHPEWGPRRTRVVEILTTVVKELDQ